MHKGGSNESCFDDRHVRLGSDCALSGGLVRPAAADTTSGLARGARGSTCGISHPCSTSARHSTQRIRYPGRWPNHAVDEGRSGCLGSHVGPVDPGAYRYNFNVDGLATIDPRNPATSESNNNTWSVVYVPGQICSTPDTCRTAPSRGDLLVHRARQFRRMHVYTPPGYENEHRSISGVLSPAWRRRQRRSWTSVGRADFILDNLIAATKGHADDRRDAGRSHVARPRAARSAERQRTNSSSDFVNDVMPYIEKHYRVMTDRANTAIAGLSMGGGHTLNVAIPGSSDSRTSASTAPVLLAHSQSHPTPMLPPRRCEFERTRGRIRSPHSATNRCGMGKDARGQAG